MRGWLWGGALVVTVLAAGWQRRTGPSYPIRASLSLPDTTLTITLPRTSSTARAPAIVVPIWHEHALAVLRWRRYPTDDEYAAIVMQRAGDSLAAEVPVQPAAGKVEYYVELMAPDGPVRAPRGDAVILRFRDPVPRPVLIAHIAVMFLAMLAGVRAALAALWDTGEQRALSLVTLAGLTVGGLVLGPITQAYAFGAAWTGIPFGWDLTDNKTLIMWIGWAVAGWAAVRRHRRLRSAVVAAAILMLAVYLIPHSVRGSQLDYTRLPAEQQRP